MSILAHMADISGYNTAFKKTPGDAFNALIASSITHLYIKTSEGRGRENDAFVTQAVMAHARGLLVGPYHFARPDAKPDDPEAEADASVKLCEGLTLTLAPVLDLEAAKDWPDATPTMLTEWALRWCRRVASLTGRIPIVYTGPGFWGGRLGHTAALSDLRLWVAAYPTMLPGTNVPPPKLGAWVPSAWQYTGHGRVHGIEGEIDLSYVYGDLT